MSTDASALVACTVLSVAGAVPAVGAAGFRWVALPLAPLVGAVLSALAATMAVAVGGPVLVWFAIGAVTLGSAVVARWLLLPGTRPAGHPRGPGSGRLRLLGAVGFVGVAVSCVLSARGLATPTVGFDARALWIMRAGWFLQPHHQLLVDLRLPDLALIQSAYPPLVSSSVSVAWGVTGQHTARLGVVVVSVLDFCALAVAALAVVECGRRMAVKLSEQDPPWAPMAAGVVAAVLLVPVAAGVTTPFLTNGYADPIWSLAAVGALAWGLQMPAGASSAAVTAVLVLVAGLSKDEGVVTAAALAVLVAARSLTSLSPTVRRHRWPRPVAVLVGELVVIGAWPLLVRLLHVRGATSPVSNSGHLVSRLHATVDGMAPYLHVLVLAAGLALAGGVLLGRVRRCGGVGNDGWAWAALAAGLAAVGGALVTGTGPIEPWILTTVHRITEFPVLAGWWIVAVWAVVAAGVFSPTRDGTEGGRGRRRRTAEPPSRQDALEPSRPPATVAP